MSDSDSSSPPELVDANAENGDVGSDEFNGAIGFVVPLVFFSAGINHKQLH